MYELTCYFNFSFGKILIINCTIKNFYLYWCFASLFVEIMLKVALLVNIEK